MQPPDLPPARTWIHPAAAAVVVILAARVAWLYAGYRLAGTARAYHVESAALIFVLVALILRTMRRGIAGAPRSPATERPVPAVVWIGLAAGALLLFAGSADIGLLSDDYGLAARASRGDVSQVTGTLFRPLPLFVWWMLLQAGAGDAGLHLANITLHAVAAGMTMLIAAGWVGVPWGRIAGLLFLLSPLAVEPVVWSSGVFDLMAANCALGSVLAARRYGAGPVAVGTRALFIALVIGALLSKETAVIAPLLVAVDAWARGNRARTLMVDLAATAGLAAIYGAIRMDAASHAIGFDRYGLQRHVFATLGMLALPFHVELTAPAVLVAMAVVAVALLTVYAIVGGRRGSSPAGAAALWIVIASAPVYGVLISAPDLQGARYLYLASAGWAAAIAAMLSSLASASRAGRATATMATLALLAVSAIAVVRHQQPWRRAAELRDLVQAKAAAAARQRGCDAIVLAGLPDSVSGAYLFRNSVEEAFRRDLTLVVATRVDRAACALRWNDVTGEFD